MDGTTLRNLRESKRLSQRDLAQLLDVSDPTVARWENNKSEIPGPALKLLEMYFHGTNPFHGGQQPGNTTLAQISFTMEEWEHLTHTAMRQGFPDVRSYIVHITKQRLEQIRLGRDPLASEPTSRRLTLTEEPGAYHPASPLSKQAGKLA